MDNLREWDLGLAAAEKELVPGEILKLQRALVFMTLGAAVKIGDQYRKISGVVLLTPVDQGRARASWNVAIGNPDVSVPPAGKKYQPKVSEAVARARVAMLRLGTYNVVWITSSLIYMPVLEFGLYPDPVQRGSWDTKRKKWVIKTVSGFSKQAPAGMVGVTWDAMRAALGIG